MSDGTNLIYELSKISCLFFNNYFVLSSGGISFVLWQQIKNFEPVVYYNVPEGKSFIHSENDTIFGFESYIKEIIEKEMMKLKSEKANFIYVDLKNMKVTLYKEGEEFNSFPIVDKGVDWFWGKTQPGVYKADTKGELLFSSVAQLWMPYAVRFYGNYFIYGWLYDLNGRLIRGLVSGGCIRINTKDTKVVFDFAENGVLIFIFDEEGKKLLISLTSNNDKGLILPKIQGENIFVADIDTGEIIIEKESRSEISEIPASLAALIMLALVATESVNIDKNITARKWMCENISDGIIVNGKNYQGNYFLDIMLSKSLAERFFVLSCFLTPEKMLEVVNYKAKSLGVLNTKFEEIICFPLKSITTLYDMAKVMRYLKNYRSFIFQKTKKVISESFTKKGYIFASVEFVDSNQQRGTLLLELLILLMVKKI